MGTVLGWVPSFLALLDTHGTGGVLCQSEDGALTVPLRLTTWTCDIDMPPWYIDSSGPRRFITGSVCSQVLGPPPWPLEARTVSSRSRNSEPQRTSAPQRPAPQQPKLDLHKVLARTTAGLRISSLWTKHDQPQNCGNWRKPPPSPGHRIRTSTECLMFPSSAEGPQHTIGFALQTGKTWCEH